MKETATDRFGNFLYLTDERWEHILELHSEMDGCRYRLLETLRQGSRKQDAADPNKYKYSQFYDDLEEEFNTVIVVVKFGTSSDGTPNNFVLTAYQVYDYKVK